MDSESLEMTEKDVKAGSKAHKWSGWPGAYCLVCGVEDMMEYAIGNSYYDPFTEKWSWSCEAQLAKRQWEETKYCKGSKDAIQRDNRE